MNELLKINCANFNKIEKEINSLSIGKSYCKDNLIVRTILINIITRDNSCGTCLSEEELCKLINKTINLIL
jgi:hypothetical protein